LLDSVLYTVYKTVVKQKWYYMARSEKEYPVYLIKVSGKKCNGCGECMDFCPVDVFEIKRGKSYPIHPENCLGCGTCLAVCGNDAITITEV
jgi:NAD-dependent dihydropyrimidine dehydrogenase PreA subunit